MPLASPAGFPDTDSQCCVNSAQLFFLSVPLLSAFHPSCSGVPCSRVKGGVGVGVRRWGRLGGDVGKGGGGVGFGGVSQIAHVNMLAADKIAIYNVYNGGLLLPGVYGRGGARERKGGPVLRRRRRRVQIGAVSMTHAYLRFLFD